MGPRAALSPEQIPSPRTTPPAFHSKPTFSLYGLRKPLFPTTIDLTQWNEF